MLPFTLARKYLVPRSKHRMLSFIGMLSLLVITCVVFLLLVFFSVTEGIEQRWLTKLTTLHSPIRLVPSDAYYDSLYYKIDTISPSTDYTPRSIREKLKSNDAYPSDHEPIPSFWNQDEKRNIVKETASLLSSLNLNSTPFQATTGLAELKSTSQKIISFPCYLSSPPPENQLNSLLSEESPSQYFKLLTSFKINHPEDTTFIKQWNNILFNSLSIKTLKPCHSVWKLPYSFLSNDISLKGFEQSGRITIPVNPNAYPTSTMGTVTFKNHQCFFNEKLSNSPIYLSGDFNIGISPTKEMTITIQEKTLKGDWESRGLTLDQFTKNNPLEPKLTKAFFGKTHAEHSKKGCALLAPRHLIDQGIKIGDNGSFLYHSMSLGGMQQQEVPFFIAGFYDPGILPVGMKALLVHPEVIESIVHNNDSQANDPLGAEGIAVNTPSLNKIAKTTEQIQTKLKKHNLSSYWDVVPFSQYETTKELFQQFQSDKLLILLISSILLICASTNIIALLFILVKEKKHEIALLKTLGASTKQIALTFCIVGLSLSLLGLLSGSCLAYIALDNLPALLKFCSLFFGQELMQPTLITQGSVFPMSLFALKLVFFITPLFALCATLVPALSASRIQPAKLLRS